MTTPPHRRPEFPAESQAAPRRHLDVLTELLDLGQRHIVDVGCGDGTLVRHMASMGSSVTGVECADVALATARAHPPAGNERYVHGFGQSLPLPEGSADIVIYANAFHHVPPDRLFAALTEAARILVRGGHLYIQEPLPEGSYFEAMRSIDDETIIRNAARDCIAGRTEEAGFRAVETVHYINVVRFKSFNAFCRTLEAVDPERTSAIRAQSDTLRQDFERRAETTSDLYSFQQPMRVNLLQRV